MNYIDDINLLKSKAEHSQQAKEMVKEMTEDVNLWINIFSDIPEINSGWGHQYFCEEDGEKLTFDLNKPHSHVCNICKREYTGGGYDAAWVYIYRYDSIMSAFKSAALYKLTNDKKYLDFAKRVVSYYSDNYDKFEVHGRGPSTSGNGKITPQALNEAIFLVRIVNILELLKEDLDKEYLSDVSENILKPAAYFIDEQKKVIHNIPCWINAGVAAAGLFTGDQDLIYRAFDSEFGMENQLALGVTKDYFWYEGSIHYNFFTIEAFLNTLLFAGIYGKKVSDKSMDIVRNMMFAPYIYAFDNLALPNPNDGWPNLSLKTYSFLYEIARKVFAEDKFEFLLHKINASPVKRHSVPLSQPYYYGEKSLEWLLFGENEYKDGHLGFGGVSYDFSTSNFAIMKSKNVNTFIKYGHRSPSHAHPDKMNLEVVAFGEIISRDLSNCGYAARLCNEFHRTSASHNTVMVDGNSHVSTKEGKTLAFDPVANIIKVTAENVYEGVNFTREINQKDDGFADSFDTTSNESHTYDWFFHVEGELLTSVTGVAAELGFGKNGYQHLSDVRKISCPTGTLELKWQFKNGVIGVQKINVENVEVFTCKSYDNPVNFYRNTVILRKIGQEAKFDQSWSFNKE